MRNISIVDMRNFLLCIIFLVVGCTFPAAYTAFYPVNNEQWKPEDAVCFDIKTTAIQDSSTLHILVRTCEAHHFQQRWLPLEITHEWQSPKTPRHIDTVLVEIADTLGNWTGKGIHHRDITLLHSTIPPADSLIGKITIRPCTLTPVHGISHVGVELR